MLEGLLSVARRASKALAWDKNASGYFGPIDAGKHVKSMPRRIILIDGFTESVARESPSMEWAHEYICRL